MKEKIMKNLALKILSVGIATLIWVTVVKVADPVSNKSIRVDVQILNEELLRQAGKTCDTSGIQSVVVTVPLPKSYHKSVTAKNFKATVDLANIYGVTSSVLVDVDVKDDENNIIKQVTVTPASVNLTVEDILEKEFEIVADTKGTPLAGYSVGNITIEPTKVKVKGPESLLGKIFSIGVEIDVTDARNGLEGEVPIIYRDANQNPISIPDKRLIPDKTNIIYNLTILEGKSLSLEYAASGEPSAGYRYVGVDSTTKSISVTGSNEVIDRLGGTIKITDLSVAGLMENKTVRVDLSKYLPDGVKIESDPYIDLILRIEPESKRNITISMSDIEVVGERSNLEYEFNPNTFVAVVSGLEANIANLKAKDLGAKINVAGLTEGLHEGYISFNTNEKIKIDSSTPFNIKVIDLSKISETVEDITIGAEIEESIESENIESESTSRESGEKVSSTNISSETIINQKEQKDEEDE